MRYSTNKDLNDLARKAVADGWQISIAGSGHLRWITPCGRQKFFSSQSPSCMFAVRKVETDMRRALKAALSSDKRYTLGTDHVPQPTQKVEAMQQNLTHKMTLPTPLEKPIERPNMTFATAKKRILQLISEGRTPENAVTIVRTGYRVIAPPHPHLEWSHEKVLAYALKPYKSQTRQGKRYATQEAQSEAGAPSASSSKSKPKPKAQPKENASKKSVGENVIEQALKHVRATLDMPFSKEKKQEIILDLLDELL